MAGRQTLSRKQKRKRKGFPHAAWKGVMSIGLIQIPVRLYSAIRERDIRIHLLHEKDQSRIREKMICTLEDWPVPRSEIIKGYEIGPGKHVIIEEWELDTIRSKTSRTMELFQFADPKEIDPMYYDRSYYVVPEESAAKAYSLFVRALENTGRVAITKFVMRDREHLAALRNLSDVLCLETIHFNDEIRIPEQLALNARSPAASARETAVVERFIETRTRRFAPEKIRDEFRDRLLKLMEKKRRGETLEPEPVRKEEAEVSDLMSAFEAGLEEGPHKVKAA